jgi:hypothetical protein
MGRCSFPRAHLRQGQARSWQSSFITWTGNKKGEPDDGDGDGGRGRRLRRVREMERSGSAAVRDL